MMVVFSMAAVVLRLMNFPMAPLILAFVLGKLLEENLRRALIINDGSVSFLWERPITLGITILTIAIVAAPLLRFWREQRGTVNAGEGG